MKPRLSLPPLRPAAGLVRGSLAAVLLALPSLAALQAGHDGPADLRCLSNALSGRAGALREAFEDDLRHSGSWPPRGCDRELAGLLADFACLSDRLAAAVGRGADPRQVETLWDATRSSLEAVRDEFPRVRVSEPTRRRFAETGEAACRFGRAWDGGVEEGGGPAGFGHSPDGPDGGVVIVDEDPAVVSVAKPPSLEEQAVGLILQAIVLGLQDRAEPGCRR